MVVAQIGTFITYVSSIYYLENYIDVSAIDYSFALKVISLTLISWLPIHLVTWIQSKFYPTQEQKITFANRNYRLENPGPREGGGRELDELPF